jgi:phosphocarrier protein HPr
MNLLQMGLLSRKTAPENTKPMLRELVIKNRLGLHARPAAMFVKVSNRHKAEIWVEKDGEQVNGKSIMGLMMLAAGHGSKLRVTAEGPDAERALQELELLVERRFDEE